MLKAKSISSTQTKSLENQRFRKAFNFEPIKISKKILDRLDRYDRKLCSRKKKKLCEELNLGEKVLILAERLGKACAGYVLQTDCSKYLLLSQRKCFYYNKQKKN